MKDYSTLQSKVNALKAKVELNSITPAMMGAVLDDFIAMMKEIDMTDLRPPYTSLFTDLATALSIARDAMAKAEANETAINTVLGPGASQAIENFGEIIAFLAGCKDDETLQGILNNLRTNLQDLQDQIDTLTDTGDTRWKSTKAWAEGNAADIKALDAKVAVEAFEGPLASDSDEGVWFDDGTGKFVVKAEDGTVSDGGAEYNWIPTPELVGIGAVAHARTDKVYRDREGGLWHVVYDAEAENYVLTDYVDRLTLEATAASLEESATAQVTALRKATGVYPFDILVEHVNELGTGSLPGSIAYVIGSKIFYRKDSSGDWEPAGTDYNNAGGTGPTDNVFRFGNVLYVRSGFSGGLTSLVSSKDLTSRLASKADTEELSNVLAGEAPAPGTVTLPDFKTYTREELKKDLFIDYWNAVWTVRCTFNHLNDPLIDRVLGKYDPENAPDAQHPFRAYDDVWLTYEEAMQVIKEYHWAPGQNTLAGCLQNAHSRVAVPFTFGAHSGAINLASIAVYNDDIEEVCFAFGPFTWGFQISKLDTAFHATKSKLRKIHGILPVRADCTFQAWVAGATNLESFRLWGLAKDIGMASCPKLDLATVDYLITNRAGTNGITVTLHPTVYDKIMDEANEEWHALLDKAASNNITIASA